MVIEGQYNHAWHFSEGLAAVVADNGMIGFINHDNEMVIPAIYDYVVDYDYLFEDGVCVIPAVYSDIDMISKDLIMAEVDDDEENNVVFTTAGVPVR